MQEALIEKKMTLVWLLSFYGELLTDNQREMAGLYLEEDLSLAEIAQQYGVSRQSVYDMIRRTAERLENFEEKLGLCKRFSQIESKISECTELMKQLKPAPGSEEAYLHLSDKLGELMRMEEQ